MRRRDAFTLIELLTVISVIAILAAITFGISAGVYQRQARTKAQAELSALASALESYRAQYGSYPEADGTGWDGANAHVLYRALTGQIEPDGTENTPKKKAFVDISKFDLDKDESTGTFSDDNAFVDPWGKPYVYQFDPDSSNWNRFGFLLFSRGADGLLAVPSEGIIDKEEANNPDNIYLDN